MKMVCIRRMGNYCYYK